jgi:hypothetical protein
MGAPPDLLRPGGSGGNDPVLRSSFATEAEIKARISCCEFGAAERARIAISKMSSRADRDPESDVSR